MIHWLTFGSAGAAADKGLPCITKSSSETSLTQPERNTHFIESGCLELVSSASFSVTFPERTYAIDFESPLEMRRNSTIEVIKYPSTDRK